MVEASVAVDRPPVMTMIQEQLVPMLQELCAEAERRRDISRQRAAHGHQTRAVSGDAALPCARATRAPPRRIHVGAGRGGGRGAHLAHQAVQR